MSTIQHKGRLKRILIGFFAVIIVIVIGFFIYTGNYYHAEKEVEIIISILEQNGRITTKGNNTIIYPETKGTRGLIFYPGGKVDEKAYIPLLKSLSDEGITCVLVKMPFRLAVFGINRADAVFDIVPEVEEWYMGGHSLGGAMASSYVGKNKEKIKGLILLGAYPVNAEDVPTLTIYGSQDKIVNRDKVKDIKGKIELSGGNHAYFGFYGEQKGDGTATITREEQQSQCISYIMEFMK